MVAKFEEWTNPENLIRELTGEISQAEQVAEITTKEKGRISKELYRQDTRIEPYISDLDTARAMEEWSKGTAKLEANEHLKVCKNDQNLDNVIPFDPTFRFTGNLSKMYESFKARHDGEEIIELYSLQCKGDSKWDVKSRKTGKRYEAQITDYKWLSDYQRSKTRLGGNDCLRVHSAYDIVVVQGKEKIRNAVIVEVKEIITGTGFQNDLLE